MNVTSRIATMAQMLAGMDPAGLAMSAQVEQWQSRRVKRNIDTRQTDEHRAHNAAVEARKAAKKVPPRER